MPDKPTPTVAMLGTGIMGTGMARSLRRAGLDVRAWNRSPERSRPLAADGVVVCGSPAEACTGADVVVTMLFDADSVEEVMADLLEEEPELGSRAVWLQTSTVGPEGMGRLEELAGRHGIPVLDAPVLGTKAPAESGSLVVVVSGDPSLRDRVDPVLDAVGSRTLWAGDEVGVASRLKLVVNAWVASLNAAVAQSVTMARALDLDPQLFLDAIGGGPTDTPYAQLKGGMMIGADYPPSFPVDSVRKDLDLMSLATRDRGYDATLLEALRAVYAQASAQGHGGDDMAAVAEAFRPGSA
jgi:3-hydroxyisobutyrate dehydrogenase